MNSKKLREATAAHEKFLRKMGVHPDQIKARNKKRSADAFKHRQNIDRLQYRDVIAANKAADRPK